MERIKEISKEAFKGSNVFYKILKYIYKYRVSRHDIYS